MEGQPGFPISWGRNYYRGRVRLEVKGRSGHHKCSGGGLDCTVRDFKGLYSSLRRWELDQVC